MAVPALSRWPTCLACLRKTVFGGNNSRSSVVGAVSTAVQIRAKSTKRRPKGQDVAVRLLSDIRTYGRKNAIMRVSPGRMRYQWYRENTAEYMTAARFRELGLTRDDIGERDRTFGVDEEKFESSTTESESPERTGPLEGPSPWTDHLNMNEWPHYISPQSLQPPVSEISPQLESPLDAAKPPPLA
ncbi:hypothetical protein B0T24DRAFT_67997 [Lasiosphaeria ovina]|uniref:Ribosomal protein L9 domain-containing protein n=1 Tax=Lasiosphaeria ovina TaxID=92902 RepID=A0AAE0TY82_9PEZI|nr:hypothetical protein B0T24DRAFT_67997 [Lasiosphaeria ovina]